MKNFYTPFFVILLILILISAGYYYTIFRPEQAVKIPEDPQSVENPLQLLNQQLIELEIRKNFWKNKIKLAEQDHFNLFIDLSDSIVTLEISGIIAHSTPIMNFEVAETMEDLKQDEDIIRLLQNPFQLIDQWASIPKDPIRVKDISGFEWNPDSLNFVPTKIDTDYVFIVLKCSRDLTVMISQRAIMGKMPPYISSDHFTKFEILMKDKSKDGKSPFVQLLQNKWVGIEIPRSDAIAIYRALTDKTLLTLCF
jgi:hypothetical protein